MPTVHTEEAGAQEVPKYGPFKVLHGRWIGNDPDTGNEIIKDKTSPPFYSESDLLQYNFPGIDPKFALLGQEHTFTTMRSPSTPKTVSQPNSGDGLEELTVNDLRGVASEENISLEGVPNRKHDIITAIRSSRNRGDVE